MQNSPRSDTNVETKSQKLVKAAKDLDPTATAVVSAIAGFPIPVQKRYTKAMGRLWSASLDLISSRLENRAAEERAISQARNNLIIAHSEKIAKEADVTPEIVERSLERFSHKVLREQKNLDAISGMVEMVPVLQTSQMT